MSCAIPIMGLAAPATNLGSTGRASGARPFSFAQSIAALGPPYLVNFLGALPTSALKRMRERSVCPPPPPVRPGSLKPQLCSRAFASIVNPTKRVQCRGRRNTKHSFHCAREMCLIGEVGLEGSLSKRRTLRHCAACTGQFAPQEPTRERNSELGASEVSQTRRRQANFGRRGTNRTRGNQAAASLHRPHMPRDSFMAQGSLGQ